MFEVTLCQFPALAQFLWTDIGVQGFDGEAPVAGECPGTVVHDGHEVVRHALGRHEVGVGDLKVVLPPTLDILLDDADVVIPVWPALLVPASQSVKHLVQDNPLKLAPSTDGDVLGSPTNAPNEGETASSREESHVVCLVAALDEADASQSGEGVDSSCDGIASLIVEAAIENVGDNAVWPEGALVAHDCGLRRERVVGVGGGLQSQLLLRREHDVTPIQIGIFCFLVCILL